MTARLESPRCGDDRSRLHRLHHIRAHSRPPSARSAKEGPFVVKLSLSPLSSLFVPFALFRVNDGFEKTFISIDAQSELFDPIEFGSAGCQGLRVRLARG